MKHFFIISIFLVQIAFAQNQELKTEVGQGTIYGYMDRDNHTYIEDLNHIGLTYMFAWAGYFLTQFDTMKKDGGIDKYRDHFGELVFDKDEPIWNWGSHPFFGAQGYLYFRGRGYSQLDSMKMIAIVSTLFELTVEIYTEPASVQDLYQTPILGSLFGLGLEKLTISLLNSGSTLGVAIGHILNPTTLFDFFEGKVIIAPTTKTIGGGLFYWLDF